MSEEGLWGPNLEKESPFVQVPAFLAGEAAKFCLPSVLTTEWTQTFRNTPGFRINAGLMATAELGALAAAWVLHQPEAALLAVGPKVGSLITEWAARRHVNEGTMRRSERVDRSFSGETIFIKGPAYAAALAAKICLPGWLSAGEIRGNEAKTVFQISVGLEAMGAAALAGGRKDLALGLYSGGRLLGMFAEAADQRFPILSTAMNGVVKTVDNISGDVARKAFWEGNKVAGVVNAATDKALAAVGGVWEELKAKVGDKFNKGGGSSNA